MTKFVPGTTVKQGERINFISNSTGQLDQSEMSPGGAIITAKSSASPSSQVPQKKAELTGVAVPSSGATQAADTIAQITRPASGPSDADLQAIDPYYMAIFKDIENDKRKPNFYAFLLGVIWYCYKGMWQKGLIYFAAAIVLGELLDIVTDSSRVDLMFTACVNVFYALMANWDYYLYKVHGEKMFTSHWNPLTNKFPLDLPRRISLG